MACLLSLPAARADVRSFADLPLESLMDIEVTSVARKPQTLSETAASVYVITSEDIRRSGATSIPEALRLAPGLEIGFVDSNKAAMAIRGFNSGASSNKLLVMIDGRIVYTALLAGVFWEHQDVLMADIDRIEVIRGPGGTMWGANAVNGVINIITRSAADTGGGFIEFGGGQNPFNHFGGFRYGGALGETATFRVYGKYLDRGEFETAAGAGARDGRRVGQGGGRIDWAPTDRDAVTLQADFYDGDGTHTVYDFPFVFPFGSFEPLATTTFESAPLRGGNAILRWQRQLERGGEAELQIYYDRFERSDAITGQVVDTWDADFQHGFAWSEQLGMLWGLGYRYIDYALEERSAFLVSPLKRDLHLYSAFVQGEYAVTDTLRLTVGSKFERNDVTGFEVQPSARLLWRMHHDHLLWGAVSRAVRTPAPYETDNRTSLFIFEDPFFLPLHFAMFGNRDLKAEELLAFEVGYRATPFARLSVDISGYYNRYDNLVGGEFDPVPVFGFDPEPHLLFRTDAANNLKGETWGLEASAEWRPLENWRLVAGYALTQISIRPKSGGTDIFTGPAIEGSSPQHQFQFRSYLDLPRGLEFDVALFRVDRLDSQFPPVDDFVRVDFHLGWRSADGLELGLFLQNALQRRHAEFGDGVALRGEVPRAVFGRIRWAW
jgi:iron complex outermembrane receptor protein